MNDKDHFAQGIGFVLLATLGWSLSGLFVRLLPHLSGWQINCWRGFWLAATLLAYLALAYGPSFPKKFKELPQSALWISALCFAFGTTLYVTSLTLVSTATVSVIGAASPLVTGLMSPWLTGEKPSALSFAAAIIAVFGLGIISYQGIEVGNWLGIVTSLGVTFTFALQTLLLRRYRTLDMMPAICFGGFLAFLMNGVLGSLIGKTSGFALDLNSLLILALMGCVQLGIPLVFYARGAKYVSAMMLSLVAMLDAVLNPLWPWLFINEVPDNASLQGGGIILFAVLLSIVGSRFFPSKTAA